MLFYYVRAWVIRYSTQITWISRLHDAQERYHEALRPARNDSQLRPPGSTHNNDSTSAIASPFSGDHQRVTDIGRPVNINIERARSSSRTGQYSGAGHRRPMLNTSGLQHVADHQQSLSVPGLEDDGYCELTVSIKWIEPRTPRKHYSSWRNTSIISVWAFWYELIFSLIGKRQMLQCLRL